jgi:hypothetical protein
VKKVDSHCQKWEWMCQTWWLARTNSNNITLVVVDLLSYSQRVRERERERVEVKRATKRSNRGIQLLFLSRKNVLYIGSGPIDRSDIVSHYQTILFPFMTIIMMTRYHPERDCIF